MYKQILLLAIMVLVTACPSPSPAQSTWPHYEKQNFRSECVWQLSADEDLATVFTEDMLVDICACVADYWENRYSWEKFSELSTAPLTKEAETQFYSASYFCAMYTLQNYKI